jgi:predicted DNA-binding protein (MmcQ/YjbR family)
MPSSVEWVRQQCLAFPGATEQVQWGNDLVFKAGGKMFAVTCLEPSEVWLSFKCSPETYGELLEREGVRPAPYLARAQWVALETEDAIPARELALLLRAAYTLVVSKLSKKEQSLLGQNTPSGHKKSRKNVV